MASRSIRQPGSSPLEQQSDIVTVNGSQEVVRSAPAPLPDPVDLDPERMNSETSDVAPNAMLMGHDTLNEQERQEAFVRAKVIEPQRIGRFTVLGKLGIGGMGTVLRAYDDTLARMVALKLLHQRYARRRKQRLLREAQALAQLSHPNVVQIYEIGVVEDQMFIAMELVRGKTLRTWQEQPRQWTEILDAYIQAGRGLAAAHAHGLIHRDFKPENCMIGEDGRVCVLDFGLARGRRPTESEATSLDGVYSLDPDDANAQLGDRLTRSGAVLGTLRYLPLQQLSGDPADTFSDQYSFCVSLYEGLYGIRPFSDITLAQLLESLREHRLIPPPRHSSVPSRLRRVLLRGLAMMPEDRWPSMEVLLSELERVRKPRRWWLLAAPGAALALGAGLSATTLWPDDPCQRLEAGLEGTWDSSSKNAIRTAFENSGHAGASRLYHNVESQLDTYTDSWVRMAEQSCRATFVERQQSEVLFDRRMLCLHRRRNRLRTAIDSLAEAKTPKQVVERTILPFKLPSLDGCADADALMAQQPPPSDPAVGERVADLRVQIDQANTLYITGEHQRGLELALSVVSEARGIDYLPVLAEALECLGQFQSQGSPKDAQATLEEAIFTSSQAKTDVLTARVWAQLLHVMRQQNLLDEGLALELSVRAAVARADDEIARAWMLNNLGTLHGERGNFERSYHYLKEALELKTQVLGEGHVDVGIAWFNLGNALWTHGSSDEAMVSFERAESIFSQTVGDSHLYMSFVATGKGKVLLSWKMASDAAEQHQRALAIREQIYGPDHYTVGVSLRYLGVAELEARNLTAAQQHLERALALSKNHDNSDLIEHARILVSIAKLELEQGHPHDARAHAEQALEIADRMRSAPPELRAQTRLVLAQSLWPLPDQQLRARQLVQKALDAYTDSGDSKDPQVALLNTWLVEHPPPALEPAEAGTALAANDSE